ncbi:MAG: hypothetical protein NDJ19_09110 [Ramlibacter sp.]|nr:hypothetical protein [Ramlibacter sp.]
MKPSRQTSRSGSSEFFDSVQKGLLLGAAVLALVLPPNAMVQRQAGPHVPARVATARLADFGGMEPSPDVRQLANWAVYTRDARNRSIVIVDKKGASVYVFDAAGRLQGNAPVLLGSAIGDHTVPGIGDKPIADVLPQERTTPAGRFVAEVGMNMRGEDVVWVDYDAAVSMHRVITSNAEERRAERLASPSVDDNRISYGCINLPRDFFETVLSPAVRSAGAIIYVLPETQPAQRLFGSYDVQAQLRLAQR